MRSGLALLGCAVLLMACAGPGKGDLTTASDDTDAQRRARVHLELAAGYLAQGKNTYALDAVKQSLALDGSLYEAHDLRALIYMRMSEPALAEDGLGGSELIGLRTGGRMKGWWRIGRWRSGGGKERVGRRSGRIWQTTGRVCTRGGLRGGG